MDKIEIKDVSRERISFDRSGDKQQDWLELYAVMRGDVELFVTPSRIIAERWVANHAKRKRRAA
jgi:hypothetical protein